MPRFASVRPDTQESVAAARSRLALLLAGCTDAALANMTAEGLAATHRVPAREAEYALIIARQRREAANG
jgi:hypothetical protein